jgi:hypothetical protein
MEAVVRGYNMRDLKTGKIINQEEIIKIRPLIKFTALQLVIVVILTLTIVRIILWLM